MEMEEPILKDALDNIIEKLASIFGLNAIMPYYQKIKDWVESGVELNNIIGYIKALLG